MKKELIEVEPVRPDIFRQLFPKSFGKRAWWVKYNGIVPRLPKDCIRVLVEGNKNASTWNKSNWKIKAPSVCPHCGEKIELKPVV